MRAGAKAQATDRRRRDAYGVRQRLEHHDGVGENAAAFSEHVRAAVARSEAHGRVVEVLLSKLTAESWPSCRHPHTSLHGTHTCA